MLGSRIRIGLALGLVGVWGCVAARGRGEAKAPDIAGAEAACPAPESLRLAVRFALPGEVEEQVFVTEQLLSGEEEAFHAERERAYEEGAPLEVEALSAEEARRLGATSSEAPFWVLSEGAPCALRPGGWYAITAQLDASPFTMIARRLEGGCGEVAWGSLIAQQAAAPEACRAIDALPLGAEELAEARLPAEALGIFSPETCAAPGCVYTRAVRLAEGPGGARLLRVRAVRYDQDPVSGEPACESTQSANLLFVQRPGAPWQEVEHTAAENLRLLMAGERVAGYAEESVGVLRAWRDGAPPEEGAWHQAVILNEEGAADGLEPCGL